MKKTTTKKAIKKVTKAPSRHKRASTSKKTTVFPFNFRRIFIWGSVSSMVLAIILTVSGQQLSPAVAGANIYRGVVARYQATIDLPDITGAVKYNIYYKKSDDAIYTNAARNIPSSVDTYLISSLKDNVEYVYKISAIDQSGAEFWWSPETPLTNIQPM